MEEQFPVSEMSDNITEDGKKVPSSELLSFAEGISGFSEVGGMRVVVGGPDRANQ